MSKKDECTEITVAPPFRESKIRFSLVSYFGLVDSPRPIKRTDDKRDFFLILFLSFGRRQHAGNVGEISKLKRVPFVGLHVLVIYLIVFHGIARSFEPQIGRWQVIFGRTNDIR
jgi:hypothetical protein